MKRSSTSTCSIGEPRPRTPEHALHVLCHEPSGNLAESEGIQARKVDDARGPPEVVRAMQEVGAGLIIGQYGQ